MKMIIAVIRDIDFDPVTQSLTSAGFRVTRISSTGGLLRRGVATLLIGVEDENVEAAITVVRQAVSPASEEEKRATIFVVPVENYTQV
ncbi:MAG: cyclic-di-AMP receptor [Anaerolineales bacterium]|nr:cyclic-di-AMP receptor [Anaerolineales bacterium]